MATFVITFVNEQIFILYWKELTQACESIRAKKSRLNEPIRHCSRKHKADFVYLMRYILRKWRRL